MRSGDFLHGDVETPLQDHYIAAGVSCRLSTNCEHVLNAARSSFLPLPGQPDEIELDLRFWIDKTDKAPSLRPKLYVRGLDHLVFVGIDPASSMLANLHTKRVIGRFSAALAQDSTYWRTVIFPVLMSVVAGSVGIVELHAACVAINNCGLLLIGSGRSGKSTLAMALTELGFGFVSDDRSFCSLKGPALSAYGLARPLKLREAAASWFKDFRNREPSAVQNGERVFYCDDRPPLTAGPACFCFLNGSNNQAFFSRRWSPATQSRALQWICCRRFLQHSTSNIACWTHC